MNIKELEKRYIKLCKEIEQFKNINELLIKDDEKRLVKENMYLKKINKKLLEENSELKIQLKKYNNKKNKKNNNNIINSKEYRKFREKILKRDNYTCKECGNKKKLQVHHIKSKKKFPELIMDENNCITLCIECHAKTDSYFNSVII